MSEKTTIEKMHLKPGRSLLLVNPPEGYLESLGSLPPGCQLVTPPEKADVAQVFITSLEQLMTQLSLLESYIQPGGVMWLCYPKGTSGAKTDINRDIIWKQAQPFGWTPVSMFSIDTTWSAFRVKKS